MALDTSSGALQKASPPAQGGIQILGTAVRRAAVPLVQEQILAVLVLVGDVLPWVWFEATHAALHVWPVVGVD